VEILKSMKSDNLLQRLDQVKYTGKVPSRTVKPATVRHYLEEDALELVS
jgi:hypothetical protein